MHDAHMYATLSAVGGQPAILTTYLAVYQPAINGAADAVDSWLQAPTEQSLLEVLHGWLERLPGSAREPFREAFVLRLQQHLRACMATTAVAPAEQGQAEGHDDA